MANAKRTQKEIEKDYKRIKEVAKFATTMKEVEEETGLSYVMINTTLSKHPIVFKRIKEQIAANKERAEAEKLRQKILNEKSEAKSDEQDKSETETSELSKSKNPKYEAEVSGFVIDASISGVENLKEILSKICITKHNIILTSITIKELEKMQQFDDAQGKDARYILALAAENSDKFESILIDETLDTPDDCIIEYCTDNKANVALLTSDKAMALKGRMHSVQVIYLKKNKSSVTSKTIHSRSSKIRTLIPAKRVANKLLICNFYTHKMSICVYSKGVKYDDGIVELNIGDDVFISTKKDDCFTFAHYRIISLYAEDNCELIFSKRIYDYNNIDVQKTEYKTFIEDFKRRHCL